MPRAGGRRSFNLVFWYTLDACVSKDPSLISCDQPLDGATECPNNVEDCVFTKPGASDDDGVCSDASAVTRGECERVTLSDRGEEVGAGLAAVVRCTVRDDRFYGH